MANSTDGETSVLGLCAINYTKLKNNNQTIKKQKFVKNLSIKYSVNSTSCIIIL